MYSPGQWRRLKAERDELLEAAKQLYVRLLRAPFDTSGWPEKEALARAIDKAEKPL